MQGVRLQSGRTQVLFKKMFPIFVCFGKLRVQGLPWQHPPPTHTQIGHMGPKHILEAAANSSHAGACLGALSASGMTGDSFLGTKGIRVCIPYLTSKMTP